MTKITKPVREISKGQLKARMLEIFRDLESAGGELVVTDRGKPVLRIVPITKAAKVGDVFGQHLGKLRFLEDPDTPTTEEWETS